MSSHEADATPALIFGWGNPLRRDDAVGALAAEAVAAWHDPRIDAHALHQLFPELAEPLAASPLAIFIDARVAERGESITVAPLEADPAVTPHAALGHNVCVLDLLSLSQTLYGHRPRAWLVTIPAVDLGIGEGLSPTAEAGLSAALAAIRTLLDEHMA